MHNLLKIHSQLSKLNKNKERVALEHIHTPIITGMYMYVTPVHSIQLDSFAGSFPPSPKWRPYTMEVTMTVLLLPNTKNYSFLLANWSKR